MSITIELAPAVEAQFREEAERRGLSLPQYVELTLASLAGDPVLRAFLTAPEDDEEETEEERLAVEEGRRDIAAGRIFSHQEVVASRRGRE